MSFQYAFTDALGVSHVPYLSQCVFLHSEPDDLTSDEVLSLETKTKMVHTCCNMLFEICRTIDTFTTFL